MTELRPLLCLDHITLQRFVTTALDSEAVNSITWQNMHGNECIYFTVMPP